MDLISQTITFMPEITTVSTRDPELTGTNITDFKEYSRSILIYGTEKQINKAYKDYSKYHGLTLDEVYNYKKLNNESYWNGICFNDKPESPLPTLKEYNAEIGKNLKEFKKLYISKENNNKPLIFTQ